MRRYPLIAKQSTNNDAGNKSGSDNGQIGVIVMANPVMATRWRIETVTRIIIHVVRMAEIHPMAHPIARLVTDIVRIMRFETRGIDDPLVRVPVVSRLIHIGTISGFVIGVVIPAMIIPVIVVAAIVIPIVMMTPVIIAIISVTGIVLRTAMLVLTDMAAMLACISGMGLADIAAIVRVSIFLPRICISGSKAGKGQTTCRKCDGNVSFYRHREPLLIGWPPHLIRIGNAA